MKQKIFLGVCIFLLTILGISVYSEFMSNHSYYNDMFASRDNRKTIIWMIIASMIPMTYIVRSSHFSIKSLLMKWLPAGLTLASVAFVALKDSIFGTTGFIILCFNTLLIYALGIYFLGGLLGLGSLLSEKILKLKTIRRQEIAINFGIGLGVFVLAIKFLLIFNILHPIVSWIIFLGLGSTMYFARKHFAQYANIVNEIFDGFHSKNLKENRVKWIGLVLIMISIIYYFHGFQLAYIPYSTAWDANHEYMYIPKILAENYGVLRGNSGPGAGAPQLWHSLLAFRFSISESIPNFWLGPNTLPVAINFLAGPLTLLLGVGVIQQILHFFKKDENENNNIALYLGWFFLLLWLTSGMGAFLVFVDNKTDLGVMNITIMALLSGFIFLEYIKKHTLKEDMLTGIKYIVTSGVFFALANMAKQTAFIDSALFGLLLISLRFSSIIGIGVGTIMIGLTGVLKIANAPDILPVSSGIWISIVGVIIVCIGILQLILKNKKDIKRFSQPAKYLLIWVGAIFISLLVFKGSHQLYSQIRDNSFSIGDFGKNLILGQNSNTLYATNEPVSAIENQNTIDQNNKSNLSPSICKQTSFTEEELNKDTKKAHTTNEDVGRYVGYGWKEFKQQGRSVGYGLLKIFFPINDKCYGVNSDAKLLCENGTAVDNFEIKTLKKIFAEMHEGSDGFNLLSGAINTFEKKGYTETSTYNPQEFRDQIVSLRSYYQSHAIKSVNGTISVPYRYIIPLNVTFNRSLQNLSSYYTDIGFIWIFAMGFIVLGLIYGLVKKSENLTIVTSVSAIGWAIRRIIGGGILWYGMGLIIRTILGSIMFIAEIQKDSEGSEGNSLTFIFVLGLLTLRSIIQLSFNRIRISSQGVGGPFAWYRMNIGQEMEINNSLQGETVFKNGYSRKDIFNLQFPHYNTFINKVAERKNEEGVLIAGTYIQYFLKNQRNIKSDGMLSAFREMASDYDSCKTAQRLKNANLKYLVIDPNIGTVGMGEGNESLFQRFFAKLDPISGKIQTHGAISMLVKLYEDGFLKLINTNNLGAKYAFTVSDETIRKNFGETISQDDIVLIRAKMASIRYFQNDINNYIPVIAGILVGRMDNGDAIEDIADVLGKEVNLATIKPLAMALRLNQITSQEQLEAQTKELSQDEKLVLSQYLSIMKVASSSVEQYQQAINNIISQSLGSSSQLMTFEINN